MSQQDGNEPEEEDLWKRSVGGQFGPGNRGGPGGARQSLRMSRLREALSAQETPERVLAVLEALHKEAVAGNVAAAREYLDRVVGPAKATDLAERLGELEAQLSAAEDSSRRRVG